MVEWIFGSLKASTVEGKYALILLFQFLTRCDILGRFISHHISGRNYSTSIFGRMVQFGRSVRPSRRCNSAVRFLFIRPSGPEFNLFLKFFDKVHNWECFAAS